MHTVLDHPFVRHRVTLVRDRETMPRDFRRLISELSGFLAYEALRDLPTVRHRISTPVAQTQGDVLAGRLVVVPVLRAGVGMTEAVTELLPDAVIGFLGMSRNDETGVVAPYYSKVPICRGDELAILLDPMLATGGTACDAIAQLKKLGYRRIRFLNIIASAPGLDRVERAHPDVPIWTCALDDKLNDRFYIVPGLGDAGDRLFGTESNSTLSKLMRSLETKFLSDGRIDMAEAGELLRQARLVAGLDEDFAVFLTELESVRADGVVDPIESDRLARMVAALADKSDSGKITTCPDCRRPISNRSYENGVALCPWCGRTCTL